MADDLYEITHMNKNALARCFDKMMWLAVGNAVAAFVYHDPSTAISLLVIAFAFWVVSAMIPQSTFCEVCGGDMYRAGGYPSDDE